MIMDLKIQYNNIINKNKLIKKLLMNYYLINKVIKYYMKNMNRFRNFNKYFRVFLNQIVI
mgnify:CR=1 FL=1